MPKPANEFTAPLQWRQMPRGMQRTARDLVGEVGTELPERMRTRSAQIQRQADNSTKESSARTKATAARKLARAAETAPSTELTLTRAARNRVGMVEKAATTERLPGESIGGAGWYFHANAEVQKASGDFPTDPAAVAASTMSPGTRPEDERGALHALTAAHHAGYVHFHPELVGALSSIGHHVPAEVHDKVLPAEHIPGNTIAALSDPRIRGAANGNSEGFDWTAIGRVAHPQNVAKAVEVLRGEIPAETAQSPVGAPKTWSYTHNIQKAVAGTPEHHEYELRAAHLGSAIRDEVHGAQGMLDLYGRRGSQEGILSSHGHTAEDSWMRTISIGHPDPLLRKATGDIGPTRMTRTTPTGRERGAPEGMKPGSMFHAWNNEATQRAAGMLQRKYDTEFNVPSTMVQETAWTGVRRESKEDKDYNAARRNEAADANYEPGVLPEGWPGSKPVPGRGAWQKDIFGGESRLRDRAVHTKPANVHVLNETEEPTGRDRMRAEAASEAVYRNIQRKRRAQGRSMTVDPEARAQGW